MVMRDGNGGPGSQVMETVRPEEIHGVGADHRLQALVREALAEAGQTTGRGVRVAVEGGTVRLSGRVPSWYAKQVAQSRVMQVPGVYSLDNRLRVGSAAVTH